MRMKLGFTSLFLPLALVCACEIVDISIPGVPRGYRTTAGGTPGNRSDSTGVPQGHAPDTAVLVCGVAVPDAYEWQKDTAMGTTPASPKPVTACSRRSQVSGKGRSYCSNRSEFTNRPS